MKISEGIMFKSSNVFEFTKFPFKTKYNNTAVHSVNSNILLIVIYFLINLFIFEGKTRKKIVETIL